MTTLSPERSLSRALVQHLSAEMPGIKFRLRQAAGMADPEALWVCGYRRGQSSVIHRLRERYPDAAMIVTGRGPTDAWEREVLAAGADTACTWPLPYRRLAALLKQGGRSRLRPA